MMPEMEMVKDAALKYDKPTLGRMAQMGQISPTVAVMAGMMRDRIVQSEMKPPAPPTVAEEIMQPMGQRMGLGAIAPQQPPQAQGIDQIPVPDQMFEPQGMAGGGVVAFQAGGGPSFSSALAGEMPVDPRYLRAMQAARGERMPRKELVDLMTLSELQEYNRSGAIPERLAAQVQGRMIGGIPQFGGDIYDSQPPAAAPTMVPPQDLAAETAKFARQAQGAGVPGGIPSALPPPLPPQSRPVIQAQPTTQEATPSGFDSILSQIQKAMPSGKAYEGLESEIKEDRKARAEDKKQAGWLRLAEAGLGIMGGESPFFAVNVGKGAAGALKGYAEDLREQKKLDREDRKILADIEQARRAEAAGNVKLASEKYENALNRTSQEKQNLIRVEATLKAAMMQASRPSEQVQLIERMMRDPKFKESAIEFARAQAEAKDPEKAAMAALINRAISGSGGSNIGAQLSDLMKKYPDAFK